MAKIAPLKASLFAISIIGFLASVLLIPKILSATWAFAFGLVFIILFIASIISMIWGPLEPYH